VESVLRYARNASVRWKKSQAVLYHHLSQSKRELSKRSQSKRARGKMNEINLEIDGRKLKAEVGMTVLEVAEEAGIKIPTLCHHKALSPFGACRICTVEVIRGERSRLLTACTYPAEEGLVVKTDSSVVRQTRKMLLELLLARCPGVEIIQQLAREYGVEKPRLKRTKNEDCILCGLCTRICQERMGVAAINFVDRGINRKVDTPFEVYSDICQTCGACAFICPTGAIKLEDITKNKPIQT
jgi:heterodisulfide reductase subunit A